MLFEKGNVVSNDEKIRMLSGHLNDFPSLCTKRPANFSSSKYVQPFDRM